MTEDYYSTISNQLHKIRERNQDVVNEHRKLALELNDPKLQTIAENISILGLHILSSLEDEPLTGIELANLLEATRGGISRAAKTLIEYQLIQSFQPHDDKKKIYYRLTADGANLAQAHDEMHHKLEIAFRNQILKGLSIEDQQVIVNFLDSFINFRPNP